MSDIIEEISRGATILLVQLPDEFLAEFNNKTYFKQDIVNKIKRIINSGNLKKIGEGGLGTVYEFGTNDVLKISGICRETKNPYAKELCNMAQNNSLIYRISDTLYEKEVVFCPNYISEGIICSLLYNLQLYTPSFMKIKGEVIDEKDFTVYTISEKLEKIPLNSINDITFGYYIFQVIFALYVGQFKMRFCHLDLWSDNVLLRKKDENIINKYVLENGKILYSKIKYDAVIIDYGFSRAETKDYMIIPRLKFLEYGTNISNVGFYEFNPFYDIFSFLSYYESKGIFIELVRYLLSIFLKVNPEDPNQLNIKLKRFGKWRPNIPFMYTGDLPLLPNQLLEIMIDLFPRVEVKNIGELNNLLKSNRFIFTRDNIVGDNIIEYKLPKDNRMNITVYPYSDPSKIPLDIVINTPYYEVITMYKTIDRNSFRTNVRSFNRTLKSGTDLSNQYINVVKMQLPGDKNPFVFRTDCCKLDVNTYFENNQFKEGIAMNASFFNIFTDFKPLGLYKNFDLIIDNNIPEDYKQYYVSLVQNYKRHKIDIIPIDEARKNMDNYDIIITVGPPLIYDYKPLFNDDILKNTIELQCRQNTKDENPYENRFADNIFNCNTISPGEFKHLANQNPRSVMALSDKHMYFIVVEGRNSRGAGMDISQLTQFIKNNFPEIKKAVNLDGGRSSSISWFHDNEITLLNPTNNNNYPIGSIISYVR